MLASTSAVEIRRACNVPAAQRKEPLLLQTDTLTPTDEQKVAQASLGPAAFLGILQVGIDVLSNTMARPRSSRRGTLLLIVTTGIVASVWLLSTTSLAWHELALGAVSTALCVLFLCSVYREERQRYDLQPRDVLSLWRTPWYLISSLWEIVAVLARDLASIQPAPSLYRVCGFRSSKSDPVLVTRRALATAYTSVAPNFIIIGIDYTQSRMLFHQIRASQVPLMTKQLGAEVTSDPTSHPQK